MSIFTKFLLFCIFIFIAYFKLYSQELICIHNEAIALGTIPVNTQGTGKFFRVLIIYITFKDDIVAGPSENIWPVPLVIQDNQQNL